MKRPCFALTLMLAGLAGSLFAVGTARSQADLDPAPSGWFGDAEQAGACPNAHDESSGSVGNCHDEDSRWQAFEAQERLDYLRNYDEASAAVEPQTETVPAQVPAVEEVPAVTEYAPVTEVPAETQPVAETEAPAIAETPAVSDVEPCPGARAEGTADDYGYRSGYDAGYDNEVYPTEPANESSEPAVETLPQVSDAPAPVSEQVEDNAQIDQQWANDAVEALESWVQKLNAIHESQGIPTDNTDATVELQNDTVTESQNEPIAESQPEEIVESQPEAAIESPAEQSVESTPVVDNATVEPAKDDADSTYGAHLWDDCDIDGKAHWNCERPEPVVRNYAEESAPVEMKAITPAQRRMLLLTLARSLDDASLALQSASQNMARLAGENLTVEPSSNDTGNEEYRD